MPQPVQAVARILRENGFRAYPVGGCVRDMLLGRRVKDWDLTTDARPAQVIDLFPKVIPTGIQHGTVTVVFEKLPIEVTTFRGEAGYSDGRHPDEVVFLDSLEDDLKRRDFTVNAMALDLVSGALIDPFAGRRDLRARRIRAVGEPAERFAEDGLRPMRAIRFASVLEFQIHPPTLQAIGATAQVFFGVAMERIREELLKILGSRQAARGIELLRETGLLEHVLPGLLAGRGHAQNQYHHRDIYAHALRSLEKSRGDAVLRLAILLHDMGKPATADGPDGEHTFYGHEKVSADLADRIMERLCFSNRDRQRVVRLIANHMFHYEASWTDGAVRRLIRRIGTDLLDDLWELRRADAWGRGLGLHEALANLRLLKARVDQVMNADAALKVSDLALNGREVMRELGCPPGPQVGDALDALLEAVLDDPSLNRPEALRTLLRSWSADPSA